MSLVGPHEQPVEQIVGVVSSRGHIIVAAVGNDGPNAPPLYPAAYAEVIAVTGVDERKRALIEAGRGKHVDFAAPGANMSAAGVSPTFELVRGTSFAAPIVAGLLARQVEAPERSRVEAAVAVLIEQAADLGARGRDKVYGDGLIGEAFRPSEKLTALPAPKLSKK